MVTPQTFTMATSPREIDGYGAETLGTRGFRLLHTGPHPPGRSRLRCYGASTTGSHTLHLLTSPNGPAPSGSSGTARLRRGPLPPVPVVPPDQAAPRLRSGRCDDPRETVSHHLSTIPAPRGAQFPREKAEAAFRMSLACLRSRTSLRSRVSSSRSAADNPAPALPEFFKVNETTRCVMPLGGSGSPVRVG